MEARFSDAPTPAMTLCDCCREAIASRRPVVDMARGRVVLGGESIKLTRHEGILLDALMRAYPRTLTRDFLISTVWDRDEPKDASKSLHVLVRKVRVTIAPHARLLNVHDHGYRLVMGAR